MTRLRVALGQINPVVGDLGGNAERIIAALGVAEEAGADVAVFPELAITGYPPEDLLLKPGFVADNLAALAKVAAATERCVGRGRLRRRAARPVQRRRRVRRGRGPGRLPQAGAAQLRGLRRAALLRGRTGAPPSCSASAGSGSASPSARTPGTRRAPSPPRPPPAPSWSSTSTPRPYYMDRLTEREQMLATRAADASCGLVYLNCVGGQDELVFDGASLVFDATGRLVASLPQFTEELAVVDLDVRPVYRKRLLDPRGHQSAAPLAGARR